MQLNSDLRQHYRLCAFKQHEMPGMLWLSIKTQTVAVATVPIAKQHLISHILTFSLMENVEFFVSPSIPITRGLFLPSLASAVPYATRVATCVQNSSNRYDLKQT